MSVRVSRRGAWAAALLLMLTGALPRAGSCAAAAMTQTPAGSAIVQTAAPQAQPPGGAAINPGEDIRDIRGPKYVMPAWLIPALVAGAALLAAAIHGAWRWYRRRRRPRVLLPFELALQRLEDLRALMQPAKAREFSIAVSDIVRVYIEQRFDVTATHRTTEEFLHDLLQSPNPSLARHRGVLAEFLQQCDFAKFAGMSLSLQNMESLHHSARTFVLETAQAEEPEAGARPSEPSGQHSGNPSSAPPHEPSGQHSHASPHQHSARPADKSAGKSAPGQGPSGAGHPTRQEGA